MIRRFLVALAVVGGVSLFAAFPADAYSQCPANTECGWIYYSDSTHTQAVGGHTTNCDGTLLVWGTQSGYSVYVQQTCIEIQ